MTINSFPHLQMTKGVGTSAPGPVRGRRRLLVQATPQGLLEDDASDAGDPADALFKALQDPNVDDPQRVIDDAWARSPTDDMAAAIEQLPHRELGTIPPWFREPFKGLQDPNADPQSVIDEAWARSPTDETAAAIDQLPHRMLGTLPPGFREPRGTEAPSGGRLPRAALGPVPHGFGPVPDWLRRRGDPEAPSGGLLAPDELYPQRRR